MINSSNISCLPHTKDDYRSKYYKELEKNNSIILKPDAKIVTTEEMALELALKMGL